MRTFCRLLQVTEEGACDLLKLGVRLAKQARDEYMQGRPDTQLPPLVAGSIGPYAVSFFDASEYHGSYVEKVSAEVLCVGERV